MKPSLLAIRDNFSGNVVRFTLKNEKRYFTGKIMMLLYHTSNGEVTTPFCLDFDIIENMAEYTTNKNYKCKQMSIYEGAIEHIEFLNVESAS